MSQKEWGLLNRLVEKGVYPESLEEQYKQSAWKGN